jgi:hypothetical protein
MPRHPRCYKYYFHTYLDKGYLIDFHAKKKWLIEFTECNLIVYDFFDHGVEKSYSWNLLPTTVPGLFNVDGKSYMAATLSTAARYNLIPIPKHDPLPTDITLLSPEQVYRYYQMGLLNREQVLDFTADYHQFSLEMRARILCRINIDYIFIFFLKIEHPPNYYEENCRTRCYVKLFRFAKNCTEDEWKICQKFFLNAEIPKGVDINFRHKLPVLSRFQFELLFCNKEWAFRFFKDIFQSRGFSEYVDNGYLKETFQSKYVDSTYFKDENYSTLVNTVYPFLIETLNDIDNNRQYLTFGENFTCRITYEEECVYRKILRIVRCLLVPFGDFHLLTTENVQLFKQRDNPFHRIYDGTFLFETHLKLNIPLDSKFFDVASLEDLDLFYNYYETEEVEKIIRRSSFLFRGEVWKYFHSKNSSFFERLINTVYRIRFSDVINMWCITNFTLEGKLQFEKIFVKDLWIDYVEEFIWYVEHVQLKNEFLLAYSQKHHAILISLSYDKNIKVLEYLTKNRERLDLKSEIVEEYHQKYIREK